MFRETAFAHVTAGGQVQNVQSAGRQSQATERGTQVATQMVTQMASQVGSMIGQLPQLPQQAMQQLGQPLQQMMQMVGQTGGGFGSDEAQIGLIGTSPLSNHPLAGGSGAGSGAGSDPRSRVARDGRDVDPKPTDVQSCRSDDGV